MDTGQKIKVNKKIAEILNAFVMELIDDISINKIAYQIKCFLEKEKIDYETINLYTPADRIDQGFVDIRVDDELYPFVVDIEIDKDNWFDYCFQWEMGDLSQEDCIKLFQYLIDEGHAWNLQGFYGRTADELIEAGYCTLSYKETTGHMIWGNPKIPTKFDLKPNKPGTDAYVQKRKELDDEAFWEWVSLQIDDEDL